MMKRQRPFFSILLLALFINGCGYTTRSMISSSYKTIYITPFINQIDITKETYTENKYRLYKPGLETDITKAVSNKYLFDGNLKPSSQENADLILKGELVEFQRDPLRYDDNDEVSEYRINVRVNISLYDRKEQRLLWEEKNYTGDFTYFTPGHAGAKSDSQAISDAIADLARRIVERTVEQW